MYVFLQIYYSLRLLFSSGKGRRLKQAKEEAQAEIESYRNQREQQYKKYEQTVGNFLSDFRF